MTALVDPILGIGANPADEADLRIRKRTAVGTLLAVCLVSVAYVLVGLANRPALIVLASLHILAQLVNLAIFSRTRRLEPMVAVLVLLGLAAVFSGVLTLGGLATSGGNMVWALLMPIGAVLVIGPRAGLRTYIGVAVVVIASALLTPLIPPDQALSEPANVGVMAINLLAAAAVALAVVRYIDGQRLAARRQSDALLLNVLPGAIADRLKGGERVIADHYESASVLFADIVNFTPFAEALAPQEIVAVLNDLFTDFDRLAERFGLEKIKTIGDAYMAVAGVPIPRPDHAQAALDMALAMHARMGEQPTLARWHLQIRIGIASGQLVAGVIGERKFSYDLWGDTVNIAARMEQSGVAGCVQVSDQTHADLGASYPFQRRDGVEVKGKGSMSTWLLDPTALRDS